MRAKYDALLDKIRESDNGAGIGVANGVASLDGSGKVPASELPSYVDDVIEVANYAALPVTGETGKIYITIDTGYCYRWSGSVYVQIAVSSGGNVVGPASAIDSNFAAFDTTTGKLIKDSGKKAIDFVSSNVAITGATKTKITYDAKGLVTSGTDATTADIAASTDKNYVTDAEKIVIGNTSGTNTGDQTISDATITTSDITTNNSSTGKHGFLPKLSGNALQFLDGAGNYSTPAAGVANSYKLTTFSSQTSVNVVHNFGTYPAVNVMESTAVIVPLSITHNTVNDFTVTFVSSTSGSIIATVGSPQPQSVIVVTNDYTVLTTDRIVECSSASKTLTLPTAVGNTGREFILKNSSNGSITIEGNGSELIDNQLNQSLPSYSSMTVYSNGTSFMII